MLINKINAYGNRKVKTDGDVKGTMDYKPFMNQTNLGIVRDFVELEHGCELWIEGEKYPQRVCINSNKLDTITRFKKLIPILAKSFRGNVFRRLIALLYLRINWDLYVEFLYMALRDVYYQDVKHYSQPVREWHRVLDEMGFDRIKDIACAILEFDTSYRYRVQDIMVETNKGELIRDPIKEIKRVCDILFSRENGAAFLKFKGVTPIILFYLKYINRKLLGKLVLFITNCEMKEMRSSPEDLYWQNIGIIENDYRYRGLEASERRKLYLKEKQTWNTQKNN